MPKQKFRLVVWVAYDSETGYVWPEVYEEHPSLDEKLNAPIKILELRSKPYAVDEASESKQSFGTKEPYVPLPKTSLAVAKAMTRFWKKRFELLEKACEGIPETLEQSAALLCGDEDIDGEGANVKAMAARLRKAANLPQKESQA